MDQLGNTEPTTEEQGTENQQRAGHACTADPSFTLAVYRADPGATAGPVHSAAAANDAGTERSAASGDDPVGEPGSGAAAPKTARTAGVGTGTAADSADGYPDGFTGVLALQNLAAFDEVMTCEAVGRMAHLISWAQAQQARLLNRMEQLFREDISDSWEREEPGLTFSLAASECAAILNVPQVTAQRMMSEANSLCGAHTATLAGLEEGWLSYAHAQVVLDQCQSVPAEKLPGFEADLLKAAEGQTRAQFSAKARRLRERKFPQTVSKRHLTAFEQRRVTLDREADGMSCLSAHLRAEEAQHIYTTLSTAARGEQTAGDSRTTDQLRADILAQLLMGGLGSTRVSGADVADRTSGGAGSGSGRGGRAGRVGGVRGVGGDGSADSSASSRAGGSGRADGADRAGGDGSAEGSGSAEGGGPSKAGVRGTSCGDVEDATVPRAEIMVLINAETLFGADDQPAELHGYGPISAEAARRLARNAAGWTGLAQDPRTGEILGVGRRRKVPAGLRRWLRARDGTCRFPGCRVSTANAEIDHTVDWAKGGPTDHGNLEHLCRRHHRFKTLGYWKACQPTPGVIEWTSPTGRVYRTDPFLELRPAVPDQGRDTTREGQTDSVLQDSVQEQAPPF